MLLNFLPPILGSAAPTVLDIRAKVGVSNTPTSTGTQAITGVGFEPKTVLNFGAPMTAAGTDTHAYGFFGAATAAAQASCSLSSRTGLTTSNTDRRHSNAAMSTLLVDGTVVTSAAWSAFGADGFTRNYTTVDATARILDHICLGGADLEVSLTQHQVNGTNAPQSFAHGMSGAPTGLLFFSIGTTATPPSTESFAAMSIGAWSGSFQWRASTTSNNGLTTTETRRCLHNTGVIGQGHTSITRMMAVSSVDTTNVNCTYPVSSGTDQHIFFMLAIRGAKCKVGTFNCNGSLDPLTITCDGITPKLFLPIFVPLGVDNINTVQNDLCLSIGASDGTNNVSCGVTDQNGVTTTNARRFQSSTTLAEYNTSGTKVFEGTASFSGESVILDPITLSSSSFGQGAYLILGS